jgi:preprotein translocase subunit SecF
MAKKKRNKVDQAAAGSGAENGASPSSASDQVADGAESGKFDFLGARSKGYGLSAVLILVCIASLMTRGLNWGIDFRGGSIYRYQFHDVQRATPDTLRQILTSDYWRPVLGDVQIQRVDDSEQIQATSSGSGGGEIVPESAGTGGGDASAETVEFLISMGFKERDAKDDPIPKLEEDLENKVGSVTRLHGQEIGPTIGDAIKRHALQALLIAVAGMLFYITLRFETRWGVAAVVALVHDCLLVIGVFSVLQLEVNSDSLAALLTIIGYSLNDTIVIMDRVRENLRIHSLKRKIGYEGVSAPSP